MGGWLPRGMSGGFLLPVISRGSTCASRGMVVLRSSFPPAWGGLVTRLSAVGTRGTAAARREGSGGGCARCLYPAGRGCANGLLGVLRDAGGWERVPLASTGPFLVLRAGI